MARCCRAKSSTLPRPEHDRAGWWVVRWVSGVSPGTSTCCWGGQPALTPGLVPSHPNRWVFDGPRGSRSRPVDSRSRITSSVRSSASRRSSFCLANSFCISAWKARGLWWFWVASLKPKEVNTIPRLDVDQRNQRAV